MTPATARLVISTPPRVARGVIRRTPRLAQTRQPAARNRLSADVVMKPRRSRNAIYPPDKILEVTQRPFPPTARERAAFDVAVRGAPSDFIGACRQAGKGPREMLDEFEAAPWRWMYFFSPSDLITDGMRQDRFPMEVRLRLDAARKYVETPRWRRIVGI
jgi:hypothetical protein